MKFIKFFIYFTVFISGFFILILEILGTRIIAPYYGSTIYVWAAIISVTLLFLSLGYYCGGKLADKFPEKNFIPFILFYSSLFIILIPFIKTNILFLTEQAGYKIGTFLSAFLILSVPMTLLGSITPYCIKLSLDKYENFGITIGSLYALSTIGSLFGAIIVVFVLIPLFKISLILFSIGFLLLIISIVWMWILKKSYKKIILIILFFLLFCILFNYLPVIKKDQRTKLIYYAETPYSEIKVIEQGILRSLILGGAIQGDYNIKDDNFIFGYHNFMAEAKKYIKNPKNALILGLGCGALERELFDIDELLFVEIDPEVEKVARKIFGFKGKVIIDDARHFIRNSKQSFDLIFIDVFNGFNLPFHIFTKESFLEIKRKLNSNGIIIINAVGNIKNKSCFDKHIVAINETLKNVFKIVKVKATREEMANIIFYASDKDFFLDERTGIKVVNIPDGGILTDDFNPLDNFSKEIVKKWWQDQIKMLGKKSLLITN